MKSILSSVIIILSFHHFLCSQNFNILVEDGNYYIAEISTGNKHKLNEDLQQRLNNSSYYSCSPNGEFVAYLKEFKLYLYEMEHKEDHELLTLYKDSQAFSEIEWYGGAEKLAFVNVNPSKYQNKTRLFVLTLNGGELVKKQKYDFPIENKIVNNSSSPQIAEASFSFQSDFSIAVTLAEEEEFYGYYLYSRYIRIENNQPEEKYSFFLYGEALPSDYVIQILDIEGNMVELPDEVQEALISPLIYSFTPDYRFLIYEKESQIKSYNFESGEITYLMALFPESEGGSNIVWHEDGQRCAFININQTRYKEMCKIFVLDIEDGKLVKKQKYDAPIQFMCGALCYPALSEFKFVSKKKLQYQRHEMIEDKPGEIEVIELE